MKQTEKNVNDRRCVIVGGAKIENYEAVRAYLQPDSDYYIFCDCGLDHAKALGVAPDLIVGDFDSHERPEGAGAAGCGPAGSVDKHDTVRFGPFVGAELITLSHFKDDTDTEHAVRVAQERGFTDFLLLGVVGGRFDHSLGNIALLNSLFAAGCKALAVDDLSEMEIVGARKAAGSGADGAVRKDAGSDAKNLDAISSEMTDSEMTEIISAEIPDSFAYFSVFPVTGVARGVFEEDALYPLYDAVRTAETTRGISNEPLPGKTGRVWAAEGRLLLVRVRGEK